MYLPIFHSREDTCQGDSGGPMFTRENGYEMQYGVVSYGLECATHGIYSIYTRVASFLPWITTITADNKKPEYIPAAGITVRAFRWNFTCNSLISTFTPSISPSQEFFVRIPHDQGRAALVAYIGFYCGDTPALYRRPGAPALCNNQFLEDAPTSVTVTLVVSVPEQLENYSTTLELLTDERVVCSNASTFCSEVKGSSSIYIYKDIWPIFHGIE